MLYAAMVEPPHLRRLFFYDAKLAFVGCNKIIKVPRGVFILFFLQQIVTSGSLAL